MLLLLLAAALAALSSPAHAADASVLAAVGDPDAIRLVNEALRPHKIVLDPVEELPPLVSCDGDPPGTGPLVLRRNCQHVLRVPHPNRPSEDRCQSTPSPTAPVARSADESSATPSLAEMVRSSSPSPAYPRAEIKIGGFLGAAILEELCNEHGVWSFTAVTREVQETL